MIFNRIAAAFFLAMSVTASFAGDSGTLTYPSEDLLHTRQGTVELWFAVPWDVRAQLPSTDKYNALLAICKITAETGSISLGWFAGASYKPDAGLYSSVGSTKVQLHGSFLGKFMPPPMQWHHLAVTWKGDSLTYYVDGKRVAQRICLEDIHFAMGAIGATPLIFGDKWHANGRMMIDELRLSSVARRPDELGFHGPLKVDVFTTLLDDFETVFTPDGATRITPVWSFTGAAGLPSRNCRFVKGRFGKALALYLQ